MIGLTVEVLAAFSNILNMAAMNISIQEFIGIQRQRRHDNDNPCRRRCRRKRTALNLCYIRDRREMMEMEIGGVGGGTGTPTPIRNQQSAIRAVIHHPSSNMEMKKVELGDESFSRGSRVKSARACLNATNFHLTSHIHIPRSPIPNSRFSI